MSACAAIASCASRPTARSPTRVPTSASTPRARCSPPDSSTSRAQSYELARWRRPRRRKVTQGVTTEILGEGDTPAPVNDKILATLPANDTADRRTLSRFMGPHGFGQWLDCMQRARHVGERRLVRRRRRRCACTRRARPRANPNAAELDTMRAMVRRAMQDGAFGVASALIYPPGTFARHERTHRDREGDGAVSTASTSRTCASEENTLLEAIDEAIRIGRDGGVPVEIYHLKAAGPKNWDKAPAMVAKIDSARTAGQDVRRHHVPLLGGRQRIIGVLAAVGERRRQADGESARISAMRVKIMAAATDTGPGALDLLPGSRRPDHGGRPHDARRGRSTTGCASTRSRPRRNDRGSMRSCRSRHRREQPARQDHVQHDRGERVACSWRGRG